MTRSRDIADQQKNLGGAVAPVVSGKNVLINGAFDFFQRGTSTTVSSSSGNVFNAYYAPDRWGTTYVGGTGSTFTISQQTQTPAAISGLELPYFLRYAVTTAGTYTYRDLVQRIEDVRTLAGQTVTLSFYAKASASMSLQANFYQNFGSGGSADVSGSTLTTWNLTTSWQRFTVTGTMPSVSGKTIGAGSWTSIVFILPATTFQMDITGVQLEAGSVATPFSRAGGTIGGELALCQKYLPAISGAFNQIWGVAYSTTGAQFSIKLPTTARVAPSGITIPALSNFQLGNTGFGQASPSALTWNAGGTDYVTVNATASSSWFSGASAGAYLQLQANGFILFTGCEL